MPRNAAVKDAEEEEMNILPCCYLNISSTHFWFIHQNPSFEELLCVCCSDTGTTAPERCVFGIMLDISAFLGNKRQHSLKVKILHQSNVSEHVEHVVVYSTLLIDLITTISICSVESCEEENIVCAQAWPQCTCATNRWRL